MDPYNAGPKVGVNFASGVSKSRRNKGHFEKEIPIISKFDIFHPKHGPFSFN